MMNMHGLKCLVPLRPSDVVNCSSTGFLFCFFLLVSSFSFSFFLVSGFLFHFFFLSFLFSFSPLQRFRSQETPDEEEPPLALTTTLYKILEILDEADFNVTTKSLACETTVEAIYDEAGLIDQGARA